MFKEFNVKFEDVEILGDGTDSLLEGTEVTKVVLRGENNFSSLDSTLKNCNELDTIDGNLNLKDVTDIDNLLEGTELVTTVNLVNINNENMSVNNPFPNVNEIGLGGDIYNKKALQNVIAKKDWTFEGFKYKDNVGKNITTQEMNVVDNNKVTIQDTLEQKAKEIEIKGQTYENLIQGKGEYNLTDTYSATWTESNDSFENMPNVIEISEIYGNTVQDENDLNIIQSVGEAILDEEGNEQYKLEIESSNKNLLTSKLCDFIYNPYNWTSDYLSVKMKPNTKYTFSANSVNVPVGSYFRFGILGGEGSFTNANYLVNKDNRKGSEAINIPVPIITVQSDSEGYIRFFNYFTKGGLSELKSAFVFPQLEENAVATDYVSPQSNKTIILLPQQLRGLSDVKDRLFYDYTKNMYVIENKIGDFNNINDLSEAILSVPKMIETKALEKLSLETYLPKTYISTNTEVQPSKMSINNKETIFIPKFLDSNKKYTVKFNLAKKGSNTVKVKLGGIEKDAPSALGENSVEITTSQIIDKKELVLNGNGNIVTDVFVIADNMNTGELQEDGTYKIDINTTDNINHYSISIIANNSLAKGDKLYWNKSNRRYEIDRNGVIEVPTVEGNVVDLPRLYQREDTNLTVETGNIKPSEVKIEYLDIN